MSKTEERVAAQTDILRMQIEERRGNLMPKDHVQREANMIMAALGKELDTMPERLGRKVGLSRELINLWKKELKVYRESMIMRLKSTKMLPH